MTIEDRWGTSKLQTLYPNPKLQPLHPNPQAQPLSLPFLRRSCLRLPVSETQKTQKSLSHRSEEGESGGVLSREVDYSVSQPIAL